MLYAKVVFGLPVEGPFDYIVPKGLEGKTSPGCRVEVNFGLKRMQGVVVGLSRKTKIKQLKTLLALIDEQPVLGKEMLLLARQMAEYYCCSWGQAIETILPPGLRKGKVLPKIEDLSKETGGQKEIQLLHYLDGASKWNFYLGEIRRVLDSGKAVIIVLADIDSTLAAKLVIEKEFNLQAATLYRKGSGQLKEWQRARAGQVKVAIGTRSAIFAPLANLGLIIIDEEENQVYKQEQVPHYHSRDVAVMRSAIQKIKIILSSHTPSLETYLLAKEGKAKYIFARRQKDFPEIKIIDMRSEYRHRREKDVILSKYLEDALSACLNEKGKIILFLNRKGFATLASCNTCRSILKCPRCNVNLVYHYRLGYLNCHFCNFKMELPKICPNCNAGYIKFRGMGIEKIESELSRTFPQAKIKIAQTGEKELEGADILLATSRILKHPELNFDLIGVLGIDNILSRVDFRASEKAFGLLVYLWSMTDKKLVIQTSFPAYQVFSALQKKESNFFYEEELKQRRQLGFPPYRHLILVKVRGRLEDKVRSLALTLFERLSQANKPKAIKVISLNKAQPPKLRGNFYWQILLSTASTRKASLFLKKQLRNFKHSGIIVTVDVDPL